MTDGGNNDPTSARERIAPLGLGIDLGTSGPKVGVFAADGALLGHGTRRVVTTRQGGGSAEQDPELIWRAVVDATAEAIASAGGSAVAARIGVIGIDSQYSSVVPVAQDGTPTGPMITWMDSRGAVHNNAIYGREPDAFMTWLDVHGIVPLPSGADSLAHALHLQHDRPDLHARTAAFVEPMDYLAARLTGRVTATVCSAFMFLLTDNRRLDLLAWHPELVRMAGIDPTRLPPLLPMDEPIGTLTPGVAAELGLPANAVVYPGVNDTQVGGIATGAINPGATHAGICIGTTSVLIAGLGRKDLDIDHQLVSMPDPFGDHMLMAENGNGGKALDHVLSNMLLADDALGHHHDPHVYDRLDTTIASSQPGANGVLFLPWLGGAMAPVDDPRMRGGFLGVSLSTSRADLVRATVEGLAHNLRWLLGPAETFCRRSFDHVVFGGGGARSAAWSQILADVLDRPVHQLADPAHANGRAAALFALARHGVIDPASISARMPISARFSPDRVHRHRYGDMHEQFVASYEVTRPIAHALRAATR